MTDQLTQRILTINRLKLQKEFNIQEVYSSNYKHNLLGYLLKDFFYFFVKHKLRRKKYIVKA